MGNIEPITGRYIHVEVQGTSYRVYFEESGKGIPLVCQHTASAEGLQWRHLLNDEEVTSQYRVISVDLPYHGKSLPPETLEWWKSEYKLTKSFFMDFHVAFSRALGLDRPVFMGCSIGGDVALDLAFAHPDKFRAAVAFGSAELTPGFDLVWWDHPRVGPHVKFADPFGATSPYAPEKYQREVGWVLGKSSPGLSGRFVLLLGRARPDRQVESDRYEPGCRVCSRRRIRLCSYAGDGARDGQQDQGGEVQGDEKDGPFLHGRGL